MLENNSDNDSIYFEDNSSNVTNFENLKREIKISIFTKYLNKKLRQSKPEKKTICQPEKNIKSNKRGSYVQEESQCEIYNMMESVASTSKQEFVLVPKKVTLY